MLLLYNGKYVYDASGKVVEVILPIHEFLELRRRAATPTAPPEQADLSVEFREDLSAAEMTQIAQFGGAFEWLKDEPDLYSEADGEPI